MTERFEITRRKILGSIGAVGIASAGAGLGTTAYFSDDETYENNQLVAGELDLKAGWESHYYDDSDDDTADLDGEVQRTMPSGDPAPAGRVGLPANDASLISLADADDAKQLLDNTQDAVYPGGYDADDFPSGSAINCDDTLLTDAPEQDSIPVIDLDDVKPGDFGEVTFSFGLCDNPGYVWAQAMLENAGDIDLTEPEAKDPDEDDGVVEFLDAVQVAIWRDDGNNFQNGGERPLVVGSLRDVVGGNVPGVDVTGLRLDGRNVPLADASPADFTAVGVNRFDTGGDGEYDVNVELADDPAGGMGKVAHATSGGMTTDDYATTALSLDDQPTLGDLTDDPTNPTTTLTYEYYGGISNGSSAPDEVYLLIEESDGTQHVVYRASNDGDPSAQEWRTRNVHREVAGNPDNNPGFNWMEITDSGITNLGSGGPTSDLSTIFGDDATVIAMAAGRGTTGGGDVADVFYRNPAVGGDSAGYFPTSCFRGETVHNGVFAWWLPVDHANEIQTDSVSFSLGLYTEQCRHNDGEGMAPRRRFSSSEILNRNSGNQIPVSEVDGADEITVVVTDSDPVVFEVYPALDMEDPSNMGLAFDPEADSGTWDSQVTWSTTDGFTYLENDPVTTEPDLSNVNGVSATYDAADNKFTVEIARSRLAAGGNDYRFAFQSIHSETASNVDASDYPAGLDAELPSGFDFQDTSTWQDDSLL